MPCTSPTSSPCTALVPLSKPGTSLVPIQSSAAPDSRRNELVRIGGDLDAIKPFDLGTDKKELPSLRALAQTKPALLDMIEQICGKLSRAGTIRLDRTRMMRSDQYVRYAIKQMIGKYGEERFEKLLEMLKEQAISGALCYYASELTPSHVRDGAEINRRLYNLAAVLEPGNLEKLESLLFLLEEEGSTSPLPLSAMQLKYIDSLLHDAEQRKAEIQMQKLSRKSLRPAHWMNSHREYQDPLNFAPADRLHAFLQWNTQQSSNSTP